MASVASVGLSHFISEADLDFGVGNEPNAEILLPSLRLSGYTLESAVGDLADNPLDAQADLIVISLDKEGGEWLLTIADNGTGMDRADLDQMMRLGSRSEHDPATDLGAFGLGSTTASLALGRRQTVVTSPGQGVFWTAVTDLDVVMQSRSFVKHLDQSRPEEVDLFRSAFERYGIAPPETGTVVTVSKIDNIQRSYLGSAEKMLREYVGRTYRLFINAGRRFILNGIEVEAIDPLERHQPEITILIEDVIEYSFPKDHERYGEVETIPYTLVQLPNWGGIEANREHGYTLERSGFYIMRNRREIVAATTLNFYQRHNEFARFRGEIQFPASLDKDLGVSFLKSAWDIKPSQSLRDKLDSAFRPYMRQARNLYNASKSHSDVQVPHVEAAKIIKARSPFLRKPDAEIEKRVTPTHNSDEATRERDAEVNGKRTPRDPRVQRVPSDIAEFEVADLGWKSPVFEARKDGRKIIITYNGQHPFYQRFILENRDNRSAVAAIDYLVYSLATAEILAGDDDTWHFIERMREDYSFNLRQLLGE